MKDVILSLILIVFLILKLFNIITIPWVIVLCPIIISIIITVIQILIINGRKARIERTVQRIRKHK